MKSLKIIVAGVVNSGRTTVAEIIYRALKAEGISVSLSDIDGIDLSNSDITPRINLLKEDDLQIGINSVLLNRHCFDADVSTLSNSELFKYISPSHD